MPNSVPCSFAVNFAPPRDSKICSVAQSFKKQEQGSASLCIVPKTNSSFFSSFLGSALIYPGHGATCPVCDRTSPCSPLQSWTLLTPIEWTRIPGTNSGDIQNHTQLSILNQTFLKIKFAL